MVNGELRAQGYQVHIIIFRAPNSNELSCFDWQYTKYSDGYHDTCISVLVYYIHFCMY